MRGHIQACKDWGIFGPNRPLEGLNMGMYCSRKKIRQNWILCVPVLLILKEFLILRTNFKSVRTENALPEIALIHIEILNVESSSFRFRVD